MELQLKPLRKAKKITQSDLAKRMQVDTKTVGNWELGRTVMSAEQLWNCAEALGTDPNTILGWYEEHPEDLERATPAERELWESLKRLSPEGQEVVADVAAGLEKRYPRGSDAPGVVEGSA